MSTGELVTFAILVVIVVLVALVGRRMQVVQPPPGAKTTADHAVPDVTDQGEPRGDNVDGRAAASAGNRGRQR